jgi:hypothetical protein
MKALGIDPGVTGGVAIVEVAEIAAVPPATTTEDSIYDAMRDAWDGVAAAYEIVRARQRAGGRGWLPLEDTTVAPKRR